MKRKIIEIDEDKCNGCGNCIPNCHEGALQIIDGKARLISDLFCDGLGACIGHCPRGAMKVVEREAEDYDEKRVMEENIVPKGENTIKAHLQHLKDHNAQKYLDEAIEYLEEKNIDNPLKENQEGNKMEKCGCPGAAMREVNNEADASNNENQQSALRQWPVQLSLLPAQAPFFEGSHLLVSADCVPFANANFHSELLHKKSLVVGCPKLDEIDEYQDKLTEIFKNNNIKSVTVAVMEVPCCQGLRAAVEEAVESSGKNIPIITEIVGLNGEIQ